MILHNIILIGFQTFPFQTNSRLTFARILKLLLPKLTEIRSAYPVIQAYWNKIKTLENHEISTPGFPYTQVYQCSGFVWVSTKNFSPIGLAAYTQRIYECPILLYNRLRIVPNHIYTGLPTKDETSETTVLNL